MIVYLLEAQIDDGHQGVHYETISVHRTREGAEEAMKKLKEGEDPYYRQCDYDIEEAELLD